MLWMITKFIFCLLAAGALGFIAGWILSSLIKNEKLEEKFSQIRDDYDAKRAELKNSISDLHAKEAELAAANKKIQQFQKELLMQNMDIEEYQKNGATLNNSSELAMENNALKEEISEYKYLENENALLHNEIKELSFEKEKLLKKIEDQKGVSQFSAEKNTKKKKNLQKTSRKKHIKLLQKDLRREKKRVRNMRDFLIEKGLRQEYKDRHKKEIPTFEDSNKILDFGFHLRDSKK